MLRSLGYRGFYTFKGGFYRLRNVKGSCFFLDTASGKCKVYNQRPMGCAIYPLIFDESKGVMLDPACPLSRIWINSESELKKATEYLAAYLKRLEREYGYSVNWRLFRRTAAKLTSATTESIKKLKAPSSRK